MVANTAQYIDSKDAYFKFNSQDMSTHVVGHHIKLEYKLNDITAYGSVGFRGAPSLDISTISMDLLFNQVATTGTQTVLGAAWYAQVAGTKVIYAFELGPAGSVAGNTKYSGNAWVHVFEEIGKVGEAQLVHAEFKVDNGVTVGQYS